MHCPSCDSDKIVRNGIRENDKQNYRCQSCGRQFVENPSGHYRISDETCDLVDRLLLERIPLAGIARVAQVSESWLQKYVNAKYKEVPRQVDPSILPEKKQFLPWLSAMRCGHSLARKATNSGSGWPLIAKPDS